MRFQVSHDCPHGEGSPLSLEFEDFEEAARTYLHQLDSGTAPVLAIADALTSSYRPLAAARGKPLADSAAIPAADACPVCRGHGHHPQSDDLAWLPCGPCHGSGRAPRRTHA